MTGLVTYINKRKNWGYIKGYDGETYYFELTSLTFPVGELFINLEVTFNANMNGLMLYALDIEKVIFGC